MGEVRKRGVGALKSCTGPCLVVRFWRASRHRRLPFQRRNSAASLAVVYMYVTVITVGYEKKGADPTPRRFGSPPARARPDYPTRTYGTALILDGFAARVSGGSLDKFTSSCSLPEQLLSRPHLTPEEASTKMRPSRRRLGLFLHSNTDCENSHVV